MRLRGLLAAAAAVGVVAVAPPLTAHATATRQAPAPSTVARAALAPMAIWEMNEASGAQTMVDGSGHHLNGKVGTEVTTGVSVSGAKAYRFGYLAANTPPPHPQHLVTVPDNSLLDPGSRDYVVTLRLRTTHHFGNVIQKGQSTVAGGNFKIQMPNGVIQCFFRGSATTLGLGSGKAFNDGKWHTVRCERSPTGVSLSVDGVVLARRGGWTGAIANSWPVSIGGKSSCDQVKVTCDYFPGDIDRVEIDAG